MPKVLNLQLKKVVDRDYNCNCCIRTVTAGSLDRQSHIVTPAALCGQRYLVQDVVGLLSPNNSTGS